MRIGPGTWVSLSYTAYDEDGDVVDESSPGDPLVYVHGYGQVVEGLERGLEGMAAGQKRELLVKPAHAYGEHDPEGVFEVERGEFPDPEKIKLDDEFIAEGPDEMHMTMRIVDILDGAFLVDTNHPLAGVHLRFKVAIEEVRAATSEEIAAAEHEGEGGECGCGSEHHDHTDGHGHGEMSPDNAPPASDLIQLGLGGRKRSPPS